MSRQASETNYRVVSCPYLFHVPPAPRNIKKLIKHGCQMVSSPCPTSLPGHTVPHPWLQWRTSAKQGLANDKASAVLGLLGMPGTLCLGVFSHSGLVGYNSLTNSLHSCWGHFLVTNGKDRFPICPLKNGLIKWVCSYTQRKPETGMRGDMCPMRGFQSHPVSLQTKLATKKEKLFPRVEQSWERSRGCFEPHRSLQRWESAITQSLIEKKKYK